MTDQQNLRARIAAAVDYSHNFATAKPNIGRTEREHILGLVALLREAAAQLGRVDEPVAYWVPNGRAMRDGSYEDGPGYLVDADDASEHERLYGAKLYARPQLPAGVPEYDRELIAEMLTDERSMPVSSYSREAINEQVNLLRAADNRDAEGVHTATREESAPSRGACFDLWMATDEDHSSLGEHIHRFAKRLLAAPQPDKKESR